MLLKCCLTSFIIAVQCGTALSNGLDHLSSNETSALMSSSHNYNSKISKGLITALIFLALIIFFSVLVGCILCCRRKSVKPGRIMDTKELEVRHDARPSSPSPRSESERQPQPYQVNRQQNLYPPVVPVMSQQNSGPLAVPIIRQRNSGFTVVFQNPFAGNVKPGRIISANNVVETQPQFTHNQQHLPQSQPTNFYQPTNQQQIITRENPSVMRTQNSGHVTEFTNPVAENQPQPSHIQQHFSENQPPNPYNAARQQQFINTENPSQMKTHNPGHVTEFSNPVAEKQPQPSHIQENFPQKQPLYYPASQQQFISAETPSLMRAQNSEHVTEFTNPTNNS